MEKKKTNFEMMAEDGRKLFLTYDRDAIAGKYNTPFDDRYLYIRFLGREHRIDRSTGIAERNTGSGWQEAGPGEALIFYDCFCYGKPTAQAAGDYVNHNSLVNQISATGNPGESLHISYERRFSGQVEKLAAACLPLGGTPLSKGDAAYELPLFDFMNCRFQFWDADDEFPAKISVFLDRNILQFMHFETTWYAAGCLLDRIAEESGL